MSKANPIVVLRVPPDTLKRIDDAAREDGVSRSAWIRAALELGLEVRPLKKPRRRKPASLPRGFLNLDI